MNMDEGRHTGDGPADGAGFDSEQVDEPDSDESHAQVSENLPAHERKHRRVSTELVPGSDPTPQPEPRRHADHENDDRLKADKPPHWG